MAFVLKEKLCGLKFKLKDWSKGIFGDVDSRVKKIVEDIQELDIRGEIVGLSSNEVMLRKELFVDFWDLQKFKEANIFQKSRSKWLSQGDANSRFFHGCLLARRKRNAITALKDGEAWFESPSQIRNVAESFFTNHFMSRISIRPNLDGIPFPSLSLEDNLLLVAPFTLEEIHRVIVDSDGNKSSGPDGFNFSFLKNCWDLLKGEIRIMFDQFHGIGTLPKCLLSYFMALIPKVPLPFNLGDFRPISLLGCLYKIIAKVLTNRLAKAMSPLIAHTQSAFIKGRNLVDGVLVVNEVVDLAKKSGKECLIFKVDFEKAYDSVEWSFLEYMLRRFGFDEV
jgi:hypothetical protein